MVRHRVEVALTLFYGPLVAATYLLIRHGGIGGSDGFVNFVFASAVGFAVHFVYSPRAMSQAIFDPKVSLRGLLFGVSQILILQAQAQGSTTYALTTALAGNFAVFLASSFLFKEKTGKGGWICGALAFGGCAINPKLLDLSTIGLLGGITQGIAALTTRSIMTRAGPARALRDAYHSVGVGLFYASLFGTLFLARKSEHASIADISLSGTLTILAAVLITQYSFFALYRSMPAHKASIVSLSRLPASLLLEAALFGASFSGIEILSTLTIAAGAVLLPFLNQALSDDTPDQVSSDAAPGGASAS